MVKRQIVIYFAHNFSGDAGPTPLAESGDSELLDFLRQAGDLGIKVCDPASTDVPIEDVEARFLYCLEMIQGSSLVLVDARKRLNLGVGAEMMFAWQNNVPVATIAPIPSYYRRPRGENPRWIHPFLQGLSTYVFESFDDCLQGIARLGKSSGGDHVGRWIR